MLQKNIVVIGAGPAGLGAAIEAASCGVRDILVIDLNLKAGGQLFKQIHKFFGSSAHRAGIRGTAIGEEMLGEAARLGVGIWLNSTALGIFEGNVVSIERKTDGTPRIEHVQAKKVIIATGASENAIRFKGWTMPGVMGAGAAQTMINVNRVRPGKRIVMLGSGNVGLIVSYQLMQAGCEVVALVEAAPGIGGYGVHAAKISRAGVPIYTRHTIVEAKGSERVEQVVIAEVDETFQPIPGTEKTLDADTITLAAGLRPITDLVRLAETDMVFNGVLGGWIPGHGRNMETSVDGVYVAGDTTGVEEANTALEEGKLSGVAAAEALGTIPGAEAAKRKEEIWSRLDGLRKGPFGDKRSKAKAEQIAAFSA
ncbi:MAG: NAD(P)/FAD-dependent oxidoreductase [Clostridiales Family XIII bacterium]|jgi:thioredoxin reductase|nr:NAD(P)/FAD-dependent oxidoreductase [Clostridiales Family XIII bacterium]